jgi:membrane-associated phospholipid phosphatase
VVGEHYPSDLVAGAATACATTFALRAAFARRGLVFRRTADGQLAPQRLAD